VSSVLMSNSDSWDTSRIKLGRSSSGSIISGSKPFASVEASLSSLFESPVLAASSAAARKASVNVGDCSLSSIPRVLFVLCGFFLDGLETRIEG
jgi:hypothetical protein